MAYSYKKKRRRRYRRNRHPYLKGLLVVLVIVALGFLINSRLHLVSHIGSFVGNIAGAAGDLFSETADKIGSLVSSDEEDADTTTVRTETVTMVSEGTVDGDSTSDGTGSAGSDTGSYISQDEDAAEIWEKTVSAASAVTDESAFPGLYDSADGTVEMNLLYRYDLDGAFILNYTEKSGYDYMDYFDGYDALSSVATAVHEECHAFLWYNLGWNTMSIYVGDGCSIGVEYTDIYYSQEMVGMIPEELRTFRFDTYVGDPDENLSSNVEGVYGLLNEFTAYCWDNNTGVCLFDYYKTLEQTDTVWLTYIQRTNSVGAYAEFRYYILTYLLYARENETAVYEGIMENYNFIQAFCVVDTKFKEVIAQYEANLDEICEILEDEGYKAELDRSSCEIRVSKSLSSSSLSLSGLADYDLLMDFMESDEDYTAMYELLYEMAS